MSATHRSAQPRRRLPIENAEKERMNGLRGRGSSDLIFFLQPPIFESQFPPVFIAVDFERTEA